MKKMIITAAGLLSLVFCFNASASGDWKNAPNDPNYMASENSDNPLLKWIWSEQYQLYGFAPKYSRKSAIYKAHPFDKSMVGKPQVSGSYINDAWEIEKGSPEILLGIIECGANWSSVETVYKLFLNKAELSKKGQSPAWDKNSNQPIFDTNGDGVFSAEDYMPAKKKIKPGKEEGIATFTFTYSSDSYNGHPKFFRTSGGKIEFYNDPNGNGIFDPQDLIKTFSDNIDDDGNGFTDDICGWDFFDDDNDPEDRSSTGMSIDHGMIEIAWTTGQTNNGFMDAGVCPECRAIIVREWDTFAPDSANYGLSALYAASMGARVMLGAMGALTNTGVSRDAIRYLYNEKGVVFGIATSDLNSANHNWPTYLNEPLAIAGICADTFSRIPAPIPPKTYFRGSNDTQWGAKVHVVAESSTGSEATGHVVGCLGLMASHALGLKKDLHPDQYKQFLCKWAEDILPENAEGYGEAEPFLKGWDQYSGYGRVHMRRTLDAMDEGLLPNIARFTRPAWCAYFDPAKDSKIEIYGELWPASKTGVVDWMIEGGYGIQPQNFVKLAAGSAGGKDIHIADINTQDIKRIFDINKVDITTFPNTPETENIWRANIQPNRNIFTLRLRAIDRNNPEAEAEDRRAFFLCSDSDTHPGWPKFINTGGEQAVRFEDLDGDNLMEIVIATGDGRILIFRHDGAPFSYRGKPVEMNAEVMNAAARHGLTVPGAELRPGFQTPSIADIDMDGIKEIIAVAETKVYCFKATGQVQEGFPIEFGQNFVSDGKKGLITHDSSTGYGTNCAPLLQDINSDGKKEIIVGSADQRVYAWDCLGKPVKGWPVYARIDEVYGGRIIHSPAAADINGDGRMEIIVTTNEIPPAAKFDKRFLTDIVNSIFAKDSETPPDLVLSLMGFIGGLVGKDCLVYAIKPQGGSGDPNRINDTAAFMPGWPVRQSGLYPDILPQIGPSTKPAAFDYDSDGADEVLISFVTGRTTILDGDGKVLKDMYQTQFGKNAVGIKDKSMLLTSFASPIAADITGDGKHEVMCAGFTIMYAVNLFLNGLNMPYNHVVSSWDPKTGKFLDAFPRAIDDLMWSDMAVADVSGDGKAEVLAGSGLYLVHAFNQSGLDAAGFPKVAAGWVMQPPAVGDIDGDGLNEVAVVTREGFVHVWDTKGVYIKTPVWLTNGHDNFMTSNSRTDAIAPAVVTSVDKADGGIQFRCPGSDGWHGKAQEVKIYGHNEPIDVENFKNAEMLMSMVPVEGGTLVKANVNSSFSNYAVVATDKAGNMSQLPLYARGEPVMPEEGDDSDSDSSWCFMATARE
jgi:hypothetical protein